MKEPGFDEENPNVTDFLKNDGADDFEDEQFEPGEKWSAEKKITIGFAIFFLAMIVAGIILDKNGFELIRP